jgi:hypothetical protein
MVLSDKLYQALEEGQLLGKACKRRPAMLKTLFQLLDLGMPQLLLKLARLILAVSSVVVYICHWLRAERHRARR